MNSLHCAQPFLKWAGGKTQLLNEFYKRFPTEMKTGEISQYVEPFIGGGAVFFALNSEFSFKRCYICDANEELVLTYRVIKKLSGKLVDELGILESDYLSKNNTGRESFYYEVCDLFNRKKPEINFQSYGSDEIERVSHMIFLNRTCFNGLFRMNRKGDFNVPYGRYKNPEILNENNLYNVAALLKNTHIIYGDFTRCRKFIDNQTFVYFDPPYRPLNKTSSFTSYSKDGFSDRDQKYASPIFLGNSTKRVQRLCSVILTRIMRCQLIHSLMIYIPVIQSNVFSQNAK